MDIPWVELFAVFVVSHLAGDYILQTEFQALNKHGGLGHDPVKRRALALHTVTYTACFAPALLWLAGDVPASALVAIALAIAVPHGTQDDGRAVSWWLRRVKRSRTDSESLTMLVDQSFHMIALLVVAIAVGV